jgi:capsular exopolysaccharide synthesis family protein
LHETRTVDLQLADASPLFPFFFAAHAEAAEQYRKARTKILQLMPAARVIAVSSPGPGDGKTVTAINLAAAFALKSAVRVLLVDADLRRSAIHTRVGVPVAPGLAEVLKGFCRPEDAVVRPDRLDNLFIMPAGKSGANPTDLLDSDRWKCATDHFRRQFDYVIVDSPPLGPVADYDLLEAACDAIVLVVSPDHTSRKLCFEAIRRIPDTKFAGVLLNRAPRPRFWQSPDY